MSFDTERHEKGISRYRLQLATQIDSGSGLSFKCIGIAFEMIEREEILCSRHTRVETMK